VLTGPGPFFIDGKFAAATVQRYKKIPVSQGGFKIPNRGGGGGGGGFGDSGRQKARDFG